MESCSATNTPTRPYYAAAGAFILINLFGIALSAVVHVWTRTSRFASIDMKRHLLKVSTLPQEHFDIYPRLPIGYSLAATGLTQAIFAGVWAWYVCEGHF
jgi:hypothetical protein